MKIDDEADMPVDTSVTADTATFVRVRTRMPFLQTVQGRGKHSADLANLRRWLIEHLGVMYRGYLEQDPATTETSGTIVVSIGTDRITVPPVQVPFGVRHTERLPVELNGVVRVITYNHGTLDEETRDHAIRGEKARFYYQGNIPTQGIDIRLGKRTLATRQLETIWSDINRHNDFNEFVGEIHIPELPRGELTTVNSKTDFNLDDPEWKKIFDSIAKFPPKRKARELSESEIKNKWVSMLKATNPEEVITTEERVWPSGVAIDVLRESADRLTIYEVKVGYATAQHVYQLRMYWDGLVLRGSKMPSEGVLLVGDFHGKIEQMINTVNSFPPPSGSPPYNLRVQKLRDLGLV